MLIEMQRGHRAGTALRIGVVSALLGLAAAFQDVPGLPSRGASYAAIKDPEIVSKNIWRLSSSSRNLILAPIAEKSMHAVRCGECAGAWTRPADWPDRLRAWAMGTADDPKSP